ncbi:MAG: hypothetical protein ABI905_17950 [Betaproteobacteria bacterium]
MATAIGGDIRRGLAMAIEARKQARDAGDASAELAALNAAARCHSLRNDSIASLSAGTDAAALAGKLGDVNAMAHALCSIANTAFTLQLMDESREIAARTVAVSVELHDDDLECRARQVYGVILGDLFRFDEAAEQISLALAAARRHGLAAFEYRVQANVASLSRKQARYFAKAGDETRMQAAANAAMDEAARVIAIAQRGKLQALEITMSALQGEVLALRGDIAGAIARTRFAIDLASRNRQFSNIPPASLRLAGFHRAQGNLPLARAALQEGLQSAETLRPTFRIAEICAAIADCEQDMGNAGAATTWRQRADDEQQSFAQERETARGYLRRIIAGTGLDKT